MPLASLKLKANHFQCCIPRYTSCHVYQLPCIPVQNVALTKQIVNKFSYVFSFYYKLPFKLLFKLYLKFAVEYTKSIKFTLASKKRNHLESTKLTLLYMYIQYHSLVLCITNTLSGYEFLWNRVSLCERSKCDFTWMC